MTVPLGRALSYHKQEGGCIYVNNAEPWDAIKYLCYHGTEGQSQACTLPNSLVPTSFS